jgi:hypothetical protein
MKNIKAHPAMCWLSAETMAPITLSHLPILLNKKIKTSDLKFL